MKRWLLNFKDDKYNPLIYAETKDEARKYLRYFRDSVDISKVEIKPYVDMSYLKDIEFLKNNSKMIGKEQHNQSLREIYEIQLPDGKLRFKLSLRDDEYIDFALCQFMAKTDLKYPALFTISNPKEIKEKFFTKTLKYEIYSFRKYGEPKLKKPKELTNIKQSFSVDFIPNKCKCSCFIKDDDLWIKHRDYFSPCHQPKDKDIGTPLTYRLEKYFEMNKRYLDKFIYSDCWGNIVLRNEAWLCFRNIKNVILRNSHNAVKIMLDEMIVNDTNMYQASQNTEELLVWERFFENIVKEYEKHLTFSHKYGIIR